MSTDFDLAPAAAPAQPVTNDLTPAPSVPNPSPGPRTPTGPAVNHTPGGLPAIPLAISTANTAVAGLSAAALAAGPVAAVAAGAGVLAVGALAARAATTKTRKRAAAARTTRAAARRATAPVRRGTSTGSSSPSGAGKGRGGRSAAGSRAGGLRAGAKPAGKTTAAGKTIPAGAKTTPKTKTKGGVASRIGQIKALRQARKTSAPTRAAQRKQDKAARRALTDTRAARKAQKKTIGQAAAQAGKSAWAKKHAARTAKTTGPHKGSAGKAGSGLDLAKTASARKDTPTGKAAAKKQARDLARARRDDKTQTRIARIKGARRTAAARMRLRKRLIWSGLRYQARRLGCAALAAPIGILGLATTPLGRRLGWTWLMYPGRRIYHRLNGTALAARDDRDQTLHTQHKTNLATAEATPDPINTTVPRAPRDTDTYTSTGDPMTTDGPGFLFDEAASDMETAAQNYEPGGMMHVLKTLEGMPAALAAVAGTFQILAEKSDGEFPLEKEVGEALNEVFKHLKLAEDAAEDVVKTVENVHAHDIARLREPRISLEAEKGWDATNNEDLL